MKITINRADVAKLYQPKKNHSSQGDAAAKIDRADNFEISDTARELQIYKKEIKKIPEIRENLVNDLKYKIEHKIYVPSAKKIAAAIIEENKIDKLI